MALFFLDSSAVVKRYVSETGSVWVHGLFRPQDHHDIWIAGITPVEVIAAMTRRARYAGVPAGVINLACSLFRKDLRTDYQIVSVDGSLVEEAMALAERHALRGYDAIQLAVASRIHFAAIQRGSLHMSLVSADAELNDAALAEGLHVEDPNTHI